jgi:16S rRNA processing protein RimM
MQSLRARIAKLSSKSSKRSETESETQVVALGRLVNTHGIRGEMRFFPYAFPCPTLQAGVTVFLQGKDGGVRSLTIESVRPHVRFLLVRFQGVTSLEQARELRDMTVAVEEQALPPLHDGEFYYYQVEGLPVFTHSGELIGSIAQVFFAGGHDIWVVRRGKKEYMIPVTEEIVRSIDIPGRRIVIEPLEGLLE